MTRDDIISMAREAGFESNSLGMTYTSGSLLDLLERFSELVAAAEREACAKVCEPQEQHDDPLTAWKIAGAIRARGQV
tara:strand:+ start:268 stop:501 length:234 start_codon:yes stop_codon:yes gene_type:complete